MSKLFQIIYEDEIKKRVPIVPTNKNETTQLAEEMRALALDYAENLDFWRKGNKTAGKRARTTMYDLVKLSPVLNKAMIKTDKEEW